VRIAQALAQTWIINGHASGVLAVEMKAKGRLGAVFTDYRAK
jgi:hypothetical protein